MKDQISDTALRGFVKMSKPLTGLHETDDTIGFPRNPLSIDKRRPYCRTGYWTELAPDSHFLRRWFDYPDLGVRGWAIIFRRYAADVSGPHAAEHFGGWVLPDQEAEADGWIARLNSVINASLAARTPMVPDSAAGMAAADKRVLRIVGNFREMGYATPDAPSLIEARGKRGPSHKDDVLSYLRSGEGVSLSPGPVPDYFDPSRQAGHKSHSLYTDGVYVWPQFLIYYLENYDVALPADFEEHMRSREWRAPASVDLTKLKLPW